MGQLILNASNIVKLVGFKYNLQQHIYDGVTFYCMTYDDVTICCDIMVQHLMCCVSVLYCDFLIDS